VEFLLSTFQSLGKWWVAMIALSPPPDQGVKFGLKNSNHDLYVGIPISSKENNKKE